MVFYYVLFFALDERKIKLLVDINKIYFQLAYLVLFLMMELKKIVYFDIFSAGLILAFFIM